MAVYPQRLAIFPTDIHKAGRSNVSRSEASPSRWWLVIVR